MLWQFTVAIKCDPVGLHKILHGEPYAGKLHVRFDEGAGVPARGVPLYSTPI